MLYFLINTLSLKLWNIKQRWHILKIKLPQNVVLNLKQIGPFSSKNILKKWPNYKATHIYYFFKWYYKKAMIKCVFVLQMRITMNSWMKSAPAPLSPLQVVILFRALTHPGLPSDMLVSIYWFLNISKLFPCFVVN